MSKKKKKEGLLLAGVESAEGMHTELASFHLLSICHVSPIC